MTAWDAASVGARFNVSHETLDRLHAFVALLEKWQKSINLVGPATMGDVWGRHVADSLQLVALAPEETKVWLDLGSGAGLPGLVVAIALRERDGFTAHLVESNARKCAFLRVAAAETGAPVIIHARRIEELGADTDRQRADVISARALAPLERLLDLAEPFMWKNTVCLFQKGQDVEAELTQASRCWKIPHVRQPSLVAQSGTILRIGEVTRVESG